SYINTTAEKLWEALTSAEFTRQYWNGKSLQSEWKVGSDISLLTAKGAVSWFGKVLAFDPYTSLSFTFDVSLMPPLASEPVSRVTYTLAPVGDTIMLTVLHEELSDAVAAGISTGWPRIFSSIKSFLESGKPLAATNF
ncbi:MAG TPA: SRPBCC domain-containing protein, partial [Candidatus Kapabacteria bacterium]|nr:SRPBCC domain-containing protein [Candidatus Kapabacteria bacterium]